MASCRPALEDQKPSTSARVGDARNTPTDFAASLGRDQHRPSPPTPSPAISAPGPCTLVGAQTLISVRLRAWSQSPLWPFGFQQKRDVGVEFSGNEFIGCYFKRSGRNYRLLVGDQTFINMIVSLESVALIANWSNKTWIVGVNRKFLMNLKLLLGSDCDELCLLEDVSPEGGVGELQNIVCPHQMEPGLVLVHRVQDRLRYQQRTTENVVIMGGNKVKQQKNTLIMIYNNFYVTA
ncbi:hypothetical protein CEXT_324691 [Caerostris extrusa]|uniref:Uncharacterized protein n=1 Tax=Caerostris extrusa TaxID=172846 RepID=A0AAV4R0F6_CAEEX|nr:hypothetical protein CEXT_324691 [Caerostris extrusa]